MADPPPSPERDATSGRDLAAGPPRWVKVSGIIALAVLLLICERIGRQLNACWLWLILRCWLGVADQAGVKVDRPEGRMDDDLDAGEGRRRIKQRRGSSGHGSGITSHGRGLERGARASSLISVLGPGPAT